LNADCADQEAFEGGLRGCSRIKPIELKERGIPCSLVHAICIPSFGSLYPRDLAFHPRNPRSKLLLFGVFDA
jgi:hypothetical protein